MRPLSALVLFVALSLSASAQTAHIVPFGASGNVVELEVSGLAEGLTVAVAEAPAWLSFASPSAAAEPAEGATDPVARLAFDVLRSAPVGEPAAVVFEVRAGTETVATHVVRLSVSAPAEVALGPPYPNPSRGAVTVGVEVPSAGPVRVSVVDVLGREVAVLADGERDAGAHKVRVGAGSLAPGVYLVRLRAGGETRVRSMTVVR